MKVCIYGAGAIGLWLGAGLAQAGCTVSVVARSRTLHALQTQGLRIKDVQGERRYAVHASENPSDFGCQDVVIIAVKAPALLAVAGKIAPLIGPNTRVIAAMNGLPWWFFQGLAGNWEGVSVPVIDHDGAIARAIPLAQTLGCVVHASCASPEPGLVHHHFGNSLILGLPNGVVDEALKSLIQTLASAGFDANASDRIQAQVWFKLWGNMTVNPVSALTGVSCDQILADPLLIGLMSNVMLEAKAIGDRLGLPIAQSPEDRHAVTRKLGAFKTSMLQDVEAGKAIELDALLSSVKAVGDLVGVATPHLDGLLGLARVFARGRGLY